MVSQIVARERPDVARYTQTAGGDHIEGTKSQLQALGLGVGLAFPGEAGGPAGILKTQDPRGYAVEIRAGQGRYWATIRFPGWSVRPDTSYEDWQQFAPGVKVRHYPVWDEYRGTAEALTAAGLVRVDQLPGQPGMRKASVTVLADGSTLCGAPGSNTLKARAPGARRIYKAAGRAWLTVTVNITEEEKQKRNALWHEAVRVWEAAAAARPRPAMLRPGMVANVFSLDRQRPAAEHAPESRLAALGAFLAGGAGRTAQVIAFPGAMR